MEDALWRRASAAFRESERLMAEAVDAQRLGRALQRDLARTVDEMRGFEARASAWLHAAAARPGAGEPGRRNGRPGDGA